MNTGDVGIAVSREVEARGQLCPMPILTLARAIKELQVGQVLVLYATDQGTRRDIPAWAMKTGNTLLDVVEERGVLAFYIQKSA